MKERNFRFRKSFAEVIRVMDDKQAGKFIKRYAITFLTEEVTTGTTRRSRRRSRL